MQLIINADDFGLSPGVNNGIILAYRDGLVTSTTALMNMPFVSDALKDAVKYPELGIGVHLNLTVGRPLLSKRRASSLTDSKGYFLRQTPLPISTSTNDIKEEWRAQIEEFVTCGCKPSHIDSHHYVHLIPELTDAAVRLAKEFSIPAIRLIKYEDLPGDENVPLIDPLRVLTRNNLSRAEEIIVESGLSYPGKVFGVLRRGETLTFDRIKEWLDEGCREVCEIFCHPGFVDEGLLAVSSMQEERQNELSLLTDFTLKRLVLEKGFEFINYNHI